MGIAGVVGVPVVPERHEASACWQQGANCSIAQEGKNQARGPENERKRQRQRHEDRAKDPVTKRDRNMTKDTVPERGRARVRDP